MTPSEDVLDYYATPGRFTTLDVGDRNLLVDSRDPVERAVAIVQGLLVYDTMAQSLYGVELTEAQADAIHERRSAPLLALARSVDDRDLDVARSPEQRLGARCHAFSRLTVALLRAAGIPARARCGFGAYFVPGFYEDHWVAEYWHRTEQRWVMVDAQLDDSWIELIGFAGDHLDLTGDQFLTAGHAWQAWRRGELDDQRCGLSVIDEHGAHWIAHNLRLDLASLNKVELLPWDSWGAGWEPGEVPDGDMVTLFDEVASLTTDADARFDRLRERYGTDDGLRMTGTVFNVLLNREERP